MSDSRDDGVLALVVIGAVVGAIAWVVWSFSEALGLDMATGGRVFGLLVMAAGFLAIAWWTSGFGLLGFRGSWPIGLGLVWMAFWPALTVWGRCPLHSWGLSRKSPGGRPGTPRGLS